MTRIRVATAQLNLVVGDLDGNVEKMLEAYGRAQDAGADLVAFPELAITGYPPEDLLLRPGFVSAATAALERFAAGTDRAVAIVGFPEAGRDLYNSAAVCAGGAVRGGYRKHLLPNYAVFDEARYFVPSTEFGHLFEIAGVRVAVSICEDAWSPSGPILAQAAGGAELVVSINASPYYEGRLRERETMLATRATDAAVPLVYVNLVGGQDELIFDGVSMVLDENGEILARSPQFCEDLLITDLEVRPAFRRRQLDPRGRVVAPTLPEISISSESAVAAEPDHHHTVAPLLEARREVYEALVLGTRDYVRKNGFTSVLLGLSGGIDSSLVAAIAAEALGPENVTGVLMPSRYSSDHSISDAEALADALGIRRVTIPIEPAHQAFLDMLADEFAGQELGLAGENLQARIRGNLLMTMSNQTGAMVLTTGNKSEYATGYTTLYGDMAGGFAVLKDVPKTLVFELSAACNEWAGRPVIPENVLVKPPSAELRPDQRDEDSLPPYAELDPILERYVEGDMSVSELIDLGYDAALVRKVAALVDRNEYKRRQAPPGVRVSPKAFGKDRRLPITNGWRG